MNPYVPYAIVDGGVTVVYNDHLYMKLCIIVFRFPILVKINVTYCTLGRLRPGKSVKAVIDFL